jgi:hypothetical protein
MAIKLRNGKYKCSYCNKVFIRDQEADNCRSLHNLVYLALSEDDLNRLHTYIYRKDEKLLTETLLDQIAKLAKKIAIK